MKKRTPEATEGMAARTTDARKAPFFYLVTFEIAPEDEREFNEIYDAH